MSEPRVVVLTGPPASGKSATGAALARRMGAALLDQDSMTNPLVDVVMSAVGATDYSDPRVAELVRDARYECLLRVAVDCVSVGVPAVMVAPFTAERDDVVRWSALSERFAAVGAVASMAWIRLDGEELVARLRRRAADRDLDKLADPARFLAGLDLDAPRVPHLEVDGGLSSESQAQALIRLLTR